MKQMSVIGRKWLKFFHLIFACLWVGGAVSLVLMFFCIDARDGGELYGITLAMKFIDDFIIIPGAMGSLLTGLLYSLFTGWGWFRHRWVTAKWLINLYGVLFGTFLLGPWLNSLPPIALAEGMRALANPAYVNSRAMLQVWGTAQAVTIIAAVLLSVLRPRWRGKRDAPAD